MNIIAGENALSNLAGADSGVGPAGALRHRLNQALDQYQKLITACQSPQ
jgi:hypothetical protein